MAARYTTSFPNASDGEYVMTQYRATHGKTKTIEPVVLKNSADAWRVTEK